MATLKVILARIGNQCSSLRDGVMCSFLRYPVTTRARVFLTRRSLSRLESDMPASSALQWSSRELTIVHATVFAVSVGIAEPTS